MTTKIPDRVINRLKRFLYGDCETLREAILDGVHRGEIAGNRLRDRSPRVVDKIRAIKDIPDELEKVGAERRRAAPKK